MKKLLLSFSALLMLSVLVGCGPSFSTGGSSSPSSAGTTGTTITAVDGYIKDANLTDALGQVATYSGVGGKYVFVSPPTYPLTLTGGVYEDTNTSFDINMSCQSGTVISPITTFLDGNSTLLGKLANLGLNGNPASLSDFEVDFVDTNNSDLAKLAQLLYVMQTDSNLLKQFKKSMVTNSPTSLTTLFTLAEKEVDATVSVIYAPNYRTLLASIKNLTSAPSNYERDLKNLKNLKLDLRTVDLNRGLVAYYKFEGNADDSSGNGNNGIENGGVKYVDGVIGKAASFDGVNAYVKVHNNLIAKQGTISLWYFNDTNKANPLRGYLYDTSGGKFYYYNTNNGERLGFNNNGNSIDLDSRPFWKYQVWTNISISYNLTSKQATVYINGVKKRVLHTNTVSDVTNYSNFFIGKRFEATGNGNEAFKGEIDDFRIYNRVLNENEIKALYNLGSANVNSTIIWKGKTYKTVISPYTGEIWLDRNLGASEVCTALNDTDCYGDYYQWGRNADGHQESNSITTTTLATDINAINTNGSFILASNSPHDWTTADSNGSLRSAAWSKTDGSSICPVGFRVPTITELKAETILASKAVKNRTDAFNNFLKLPSAGYRDGSNGGSLFSQSYGGFVWSSGVTGTYSQGLRFYSGGADVHDGNRADGFSVRCVRD